MPTQPSADGILFPITAGKGGRDLSALGPGGGLGQGRICLLHAEEGDLSLVLESQIHVFSSVGIPGEEVEAGNTDVQRFCVARGKSCDWYHLRVRMEHHLTIQDS